MDFTQNPLHTHMPITVSIGIPPANEGVDGQVKEDITTGTFYYKQPNVGWVSLATYQSTVFPAGMGVKGFDANGFYGKYQNGSVVVAASSVKSHVLSSADQGPVQCDFDSIFLPPNFVGPDGWFELDVIWGCNSSANAKSCTPLLNWSASFPTTGNIGQDTQTTNTTNRYTVKILNRNNASKQMMFPSLGSNNSTNPIYTATLDLSGANGAMNYIKLTGNILSAVGGDSCWVESWTLKAHNPPVYSTSRLNPGKVQFYGANGHFDDSQSIAQHISDMKVMGFKTLRLTYEPPSSLPTLVAYAQAIQTDNTGIQMFCCIDASITSDGSTLWPSEAAAYQYGYAMAYQVATTLAPWGVTLFEAGNEMDTKVNINTGDPQGGYPSYYNAAKVTIFRGVQRGLIDGVHAAGAALGKTLYCASNAYTTCAIGLADMMWNGTNPDGSKAASGPMRWDMTSWHNYEDYGPLMAVEANFQGPYVNILEHCNRVYGGVPIVITEWNAKASDTDVQRAAWANRFMGELYNNRYKYNIASIMVYALYGSPWTVMASAGVPLSTFGTTVQAFISANPDTGT